MAPSTDTDHEITQTEPEAHSMSKRKACLLLALSFALLVVGITAEAWVVGLLSAACIVASGVTGIGALIAKLRY